MLLEIDGAQPLKHQLGDYLRAKEVPTDTVKIDDVVYVMELDGTFKKYSVVGFGEDKFVNGTNVLGAPYVNRFLNDDVYSGNINNYLLNKDVRLAVTDIEK